MDPVIAAKYKLDPEKAYVVRWISQYVNVFAMIRCYRFCRIAPFNKATHVIGVREILVITRLDREWKSKMPQWKKITAAELEEARPFIRGQAQNPDVVSPRKLNYQFI